MTDITPWDVAAVELNYDKIVREFGCKFISEELIKKMEEISGKKASHLIRRGIVFAHRDLDLLLTQIAEKKSFYLYTGRGPSTKSMHLGHVIPFMLCKYLQDTFDVPLVIQITDDEKFLVKNLKLSESIENAKSNIKDIIAFGFNPEKTFIFNNVDIYDGKSIFPESTKARAGTAAEEKSFNGFFKKELILAKNITFHEGSKVFGFDGDTNLGKISFPVRQILPCYYSTFSFLEKSNCLVPAAIDQDPFFRLARDKCNVFECEKPSTIYSCFLPSLSNLGKMSSSKERTIFLDDTDEQISYKIHKYAFSGGRETLKEHREKGGNLNVDIAYQYLRFFMEDEEKLQKVANKYSSGELTSTEIKNICIKELQKFVQDFKKKRNEITNDQIAKFMSSNKRFY